MYPNQNFTNVIYNILVAPHKLLNESNKFTSKNFEEVFKEKQTNELELVN